MSHRFGGALVVLVIISLFVRPQLVAAHEVCFPSEKTSYCLSDPFSDYWESNGGLPVFGYPITAPASEVNADTGQTYNTQWVERTRLEDHPENAGTPYCVLLGLLGKERLGQLGRDPASEPREAGAKDGCLWFDQTGHNVCNIQAGLGFKAYWESHGLKIAGLDKYSQSLQLFGLPLTEPKTETNANGDTVLTQWFERARFEWHPGNPDQFKVLLGLLGTEVRGGSGPPPAPPAGEDPCQGIAAPPTGAEITPVCMQAGDAFTTVGAGFRVAEPVGIYVSGPDGGVFVPAVIAGDASATPEGQYHLKAALAAFSLPGDYVLTLEGVQSGQRVTIPFRILPGAPTGIDESLLPPSINGEADPLSGPRGTVVTFSASGFNPLEIVSVYGTYPDNSVDGAPFQVRATQLGDVGQNVRFTLDETYQIGVYATTFEGVDSGRKAIMYHRATP
ncbi:MAG: hypothetical protein H0T53_08340 [Herpetosiphonaceae bacterium]|nr:hypothetical protein [Herpetosiphonaceae bacterium]